MSDTRNNVICHQDDYFRDPTETCHGGSAGDLKNRSRKPTFAKDSTGQLLDKLKAPERWTRQQQV